MAQSIVVQVGQCGNQIASRFWDLALQEHAALNKKGVYDDALATFFRNANTRRGIQNIPVGDGTGKVTGLKARSVMIDMEEGVINQIQNSPIAGLFDEHQHITSNSGSGNNWAVGYKVYGEEFKEPILESIRKEAEFCDSLQSFFTLSSLGGGTGSGLGSFVMEAIADAYPDVYRFSTVICPSQDDDVVTSPYNALLSLSKMIEHADCILPVENQALIDIIRRITSSYDVQTSGLQKATTITDSGEKAYGGLCSGKRKKHPFDDMNNIVANLILNMTSSMRFEGSMNVDINDIVTNLVPFPRQKCLLSCMTPLYTLADLQAPVRRLDQMFTDAFSRDSQLVKADPKSGTYLACALIVRGDVEISDLRRNIDRMKSSLNFVSWNQQGWKTGLCSVPPLGQTYSLLTMANNTCIHESLGEVKSRFLKLYRKKANLHHYTRHIDTAMFQDALETVTNLIEEYKSQK